ncbi:nucleotidyltransferase domain-containing protein [Clostridium weizhouense]|uniref:Nucleotidyltransferase domain-containing protein n=1 Tax=Clostridium weizhouense TaxID=2859781 RepID=A0ABS7AK98_9CLOT|nr:nucleotidyltransferase domain-containing protein [Clostridium weizhouense]MBW6409082.1 nucleotidyltransferase domain-containing protein [Clostridium weizhouense]
MDTDGFINGLKKINNVICVCKFGSYGSEYWIEGRSDIDLAVIVKSGVTIMDTLDIEEDIIELAKEYYDYDNIHLTFILFNDFGSKFARIAVDSEEQYIVDYNNWYDFQHYVLKFIRNNLKIEKILKIDEQYRYFGGVIDESLL